MFIFANMFPEDTSRGITKKVFAQIQALDHIGHEVRYYTGYTEEGAAVFDRKGNIVYFREFPAKSKIINRVLRNKTLKNMAFEFLKGTDERFTEMYFRYVFFDYSTMKLYKEAKNHTKTVILEMHSYPNYNKGQYVLYPVFVIDRIYRKANLKYIDKIVTISSFDNIFGKETIRIDNGVDLDHIRRQTKTVHEGIRIISVPYEWLAHGYDRLVRGLYNYYTNSHECINVELWFVGTIMDSTKKLIKELNMEGKIKYLGIKKGNELDEIYDQVDIGAGCLGMHRCNTKDSSGLKTKEYIAKGIPFFYAGEPLFDKNSFPYAMQVESTDAPIDIKAVLDFYYKLKSDDTIPEKMRKWAEKYTWDEEMKKIFKR